MNDPSSLKSSSSFRTEVMKLLHDVMIIFDPSGINGKQWEDHFKKFDDKAFVKEIKRFLDDPKLHFSPEIAAFDKNRQPKLENFKTLAKMLKIELDEYVVLPYLNEKTSMSSPSMTLTKVPVGPVHLKRLQQIVRKKNKIVTSIENRDMQRGQVRNQDKGARITDMDAYALSTIGADPIMHELYGPRADSMDTKAALYKSIRDGTRLPRMADMPNDPGEKIATNTMNHLILGASLISDISSDSYMLPITKSDILKNRFAKEEQPKTHVTP
jgi:hypothetical protein